VAIPSDEFGLSASSLELVNSLERLWVCPGEKNEAPPRGGARNSTWT